MDSSLELREGYLRDHAFAYGVARKPEALRNTVVRGRDPTDTAGSLK